MNIEYYFDNKSGSCRRTTCVIEELAVPVTKMPLNLLTAEHLKNEILALNSSKMLPFIHVNRGKIDEQIISEAAVINMFLCDNYGGEKLLPKSSQRYEVLSWMSWAAEHFRQAAPVYFEENVIKKLEGLNPDNIRLDLADQYLVRFGERLNHHLENKDYVVGNSFTLADIDLAAPLSQMHRSRVPYDQFPNIMRWADGLEERHPSWRNAGTLLDQEMDAVLIT